MRTTINMDDTILRGLKKMQREERKPPGTLVSELLAAGLAAQKHRTRPAAFAWVTQEMGARLAVADRNALEDALDEPLP